MEHVIFLTHLPLLSMVRQEDFAIGSGVLTKLPWQQFDGICQGAFTDWQRKYEAADPVFFWFQEGGEFPFVREGGARGMQEIKLPTASWSTMLPALGHGRIELLHQHIVDPVWASLALAAPAGIPAPPRTSLTFFLPAGNATFEIAGLRTNGVRVQGDADHELAYLPDATCAPLSDDDLRRAASLVDIASWALQDQTIGPSLRRLMWCGEVTLTPTERMLLAVTATEELLLPDVTTQSGETFARRLANLLGDGEPHRETLQSLARTLYRVRSAVIHSESPGAIDPVLPPAVAEQLLAGVIEASARALMTGLDLERLRQDLDAGPAGWHPAVRVPSPQPPGRGQSYRLGPRHAWWSGTFSSGVSLRSPEGAIISWSPLVGLTLETSSVQHDGLGLQVGVLEADTLVSMEEKDIRRDFIAKTRVASVPIAGLAVLAPRGTSGIDDETMAPLLRVRDLAVAGLRLAGYSAFIDPELTGWYVFDGNLRHRRETVLRQSIIMSIEGAHTTAVTEQGMQEVMDLWSLLARYDKEVRDPTLDRVLDLFRRVHDRRFLLPSTRAHLAWICVEAILGRFRSPSGAVRLETLVGVLEGLPTATREWFQHNGRAFRNALAHGDWTPPPLTAPELWQADYEPLPHILEVARASVRAALALWVAVDPPVRARYGLSRLLVRRLTKALGRDDQHG